MNKFFSLPALFATAVFTVAAGAGEVESVREIPVWKINYTPERGLPNPVQWRNNYPGGAVRVVSLSTPLLLAINDFDAKKPFGEFSFIGSGVLEGFTDKVALDFTLRPLDFGGKDFFFMVLMRLRNRAGKEVPVIVKLGGERMSSSVGLAEYPSRLSDRPVRVTVLADLETERMKLWLDDKLLLEGAILPEDKEYGTKLTFGDASTLVGGAYLLENLRVTTVE